MVARKKKQETLIEDEDPQEYVLEDVPVSKPKPEPKPDPEPEPEPEPEPAALTKNDIRIVVESMITKPKSKGSVPTFVSFREKEEGLMRHVLLDIPEPFMREAWEFYRNNSKKPCAEEFLIMVYDIMKKGIPRLYRKVAVLSLE